MVVGWERRAGGDGRLGDVRKDFLAVAEVQRTGQGQQAGGQCTQGDPAIRHVARAEEGGTETFDHTDHGVQGVDPLRPDNDVAGERVGLGDQAGRVDDRCDVHEDLHDKRHGMLDVAKLDGQRGEPHAETEGREHHQQHEVGNHEKAPCRRLTHRDEENDGDGHRNREIEQFGNNCGQREDHPREVDFRQHLGIRDQAVGTIGQGVGKISPGHKGHQAERGVTGAVGLHAGQLAEDHREDQHLKDGLNDRPADADGRLGVADLDAAPREEAEEVAVGVEFAPIDQSPRRGGLDDGDVFIALRGLGERRRRSEFSGIQHFGRQSRVSTKSGCRKRPELSACGRRNHTWKRSFLAPEHRLVRENLAEQGALLGHGEERPHHPAEQAHRMCRH